MSINVGLSSDEKYSGVLGFSGKIISKKDLSKRIIHKPETLLIHGENDDIVPCVKSLEAKDFLERNKVPVQLEIIKNCKFIVIDQIPQFNDTNSNQQQRFITLLDVIYDKNISIAVTSNQSLDELTSSRLLEKPFKRTISRLYELTSRG